MPHHMIMKRASPSIKNKTENQSENCGLLKMEDVEVKSEVKFGLSGPENPQSPIFAAVGAI